MLKKYGAIFLILLKTFHKKNWVLCWYQICNVVLVAIFLPSLNLLIGQIKLLISCLIKAIELEPQERVIVEDVVIENNIDKIDLQAVEEKLIKARTQLILDKPF